MTFKVDGEPTDRAIYRDRPKLAEINGRVVNGMFTGMMIVPQSPMANGDDVQIRVFAHKDNSDYMVNGFTKQVTMLPYDQTAAIDDSEAPVITSMFLNDETSFADGAVIAPSAMLYISASDNEGISMQANSAAYTMKLLLDGGKQSYEDVTCYAAVDDGGRVVNIEFPLSSLSEGQHTLTYMVYDMLGNCASRTITFMVGQNTVVDLVADKMPAFLDGVVNFDVETELTLVPEMVVRVTDATGKLMWTTTTSSFPVAWDMKDMDGNKVPAGLYRYFGSYNDGVNYGGTPINKLIVLDPINVSND